MEWPKIAGPNRAAAREITAAAVPEFDRLHSSDIGELRSVLLGHFPVSGDVLSPGTDGQVGLRDVAIRVLVIGGNNLAARTWVEHAGRARRRRRVPEPNTWA